MMFKMILLDGSQEAADRLEWYLNDGHAVIDRFVADTFIYVMLKK